MPGSILPFCSCLSLPWVARFGCQCVIRLLITLLEAWAQGAVVPARPQPLPELGHRALAAPTPAYASLAGTANFSLPDSHGSWCSTGFHLCLWWKAIWKTRGELLVWAQGQCPSVAVLGTSHRHPPDAEHHHWGKAFSTDMIYLQADKM